jgi:hypothetical protein
LVSKKQRREIEESADIEDDLRANSEADFDKDLEFASRSGSYSSDDMPNDIYRYKRMRLVPNSERDFAGLVDKDVVLANVKDNKPDPLYLRFVAETIVALDVFSTEVLITRRDSNGAIIMMKDDDGRLVPVRDIKVVPDPQFDIIRDFLKSGFKADLTLSRAMGKDREAVLDRTQGFSKEIKRPDRANKYGGN